MQNLLKTCTLILSGIVATSLAMQPLPAPIATAPQEVILVHKKRPAEDLLNPIPPSLSAKPVVQINALLEQTDTFSCVYRSLFHAQCISMAVQQVAQGHPVEQSLKTLLLDQELLNRTFGYVKDYLDQHHPTYNKSSGLCLHHLLGVCAASIPLLHTKLLPILLEDDKKIYAVHDPTPVLPSPLHYSADFIRHYGSHRFLENSCKVELDKSTQLAHQLAQLKTPHSVAHFMCRFPSHIFIASIVTDTEGFAKLYVIDSNNNSLAYAPIHTLMAKVLAYVESYNKNYALQLAKKQKACPQPTT